MKGSVKQLHDDAASGIVSICQCNTYTPNASARNRSQQKWEASPQISRAPAGSDYRTLRAGANTEPSSPDGKLILLTAGGALVLLDFRPTQSLNRNQKAVIHSKKNDQKFLSHLVFCIECVSCFLPRLCSVFQYTSNA